ncbi:MAG: PD-(D/E)XK nuclease family protein [Clostridia bacterium]|nr:PD-(D/E)XK nuclease family protein [Clostridia bacterium]
MSFLKGAAATAVTAALYGATGVSLAESKPAVSYTPGTYTATATGMGEVTMTATCSENAITDIVLDVSNETEGIGTAAHDALVQQLLEAQCAVAAEKIAALIDGTDTEQARACQYRDIAILIRSARTDAPRMVEIFKRLHVPVYYDGAMNYYGLSEIAIFLALLNVIDNMHQDIPLLAALRQAPFYLSDHDLQAIRMIAPGHVPFYEAFERATLETELPIGRQCAEICQRIEEWHLLSGTMKASDFIWRLLRETGFYAVCGAYPDGRLRQNNLDMLYQKALDMEKRGIYRLSDFLSQIQTVIDRGQKDSDSPVAGTETDNCVRLMTMHKSKGLEFRAVLLMNLGKNMRKKNPTDSLQIDLGQDEADRPALGLYLPVINPEKNTRRNTFGKSAFARRSIRNEIAEQTRLLYVAMTRAMEKLILIGTFKDGEEDLWRETNAISRIWRTRSMHDMVMPAVISECPLPETDETVTSSHWKLTVQSLRPLQSDEGPQDFERIKEQILRLIQKEPEAERIWDRAAQPQYPLKTSVSSLVRNADQAGNVPYYHRSEDTEETAETKRLPEGVSLVPFLLDQTPGKPRFMEIRRPSAQDRGTATHRFLRLIDLQKAGNTGDAEMEQLIHSEIDRLLDSGVLSREEGELIDLNGVVRFFTSDLGHLLTHAEKVHREWPFTYRISMETGTIIQGIIDVAVMVRGSWILIDYKTDHDTAPERFVTRHRQQMNWYREAIEHLTGIQVSEMWLFALRSGQAHRVEPMPPSSPRIIRENDACADTDSMGKEVLR